MYVKFQSIASLLSYSIKLYTILYIKSSHTNFEIIVNVNRVYNNLYAIGSGFSVELSFSCDDTGIRPEKQLEHVQKLHSEVERLRTVLTEQYPDQMASQCTVQ